MDKQPSQRPKSSLERCARLRFAYGKEQIRLTGVKMFTKVLPAARQIPAGSVGTWIELVDREGRVLWTRSLGQVMQFDLELHSGTKGRSFARVPNPDASGVFEVVVPMLRQSAGARLFTPPLRPNASHVPAQARLQLAFDADREIWSEVKP